MDEEKKKQIAVFRFGVIADFVTGATLSRGEKERLLKDKCARKWNIPYSNRTSIGRSTIRDWIANYQDGGNRLEALYPNDCTDKGKSRSIDEQTSDNLICLRGQMPKATIGASIETMTQRKLITMAGREWDIVGCEGIQKITNQKHQHFNRPASHILGVAFLPENLIIGRGICTRLCRIKSHMPPTNCHSVLIADIFMPVIRILSESW